MTPSSKGGEDPSVPEIADDPTDHQWNRPETTEGSLEHAPDGQEWNVVPKGGSSTGGDPVAPAAPPMPRWVKIGGALLILALLGGASWIGLTLGTPEPSPTPSPSPTPTIRDWPLKLPPVHEEWVAGPVETTEPLPGTERIVLSADYSNGTEQVALVVSRPEVDITQYLVDANVGETERIGNAMCGYYEDTGTPLCVRILDNTGIMVAGLDGQALAILSALLDGFSVEMAGPEATASPAPSESPGTVDSPNPEASPGQETTGEN